MLISLENELSALRSLRNALLSLQGRYQRELEANVDSGAIPSSVDKLTSQQISALKYNAERVEAINLLLDRVRELWADIFVADLIDAAGSSVS